MQTDLNHQIQQFSPYCKIKERASQLKIEKQIEKLTEMKKINGVDLFLGDIEFK